MLPCFIHFVRWVLKEGAVKFGHVKKPFCASRRPNPGPAPGPSRRCRPTSTPPLARRPVSSTCSPSARGRSRSGTRPGPYPKRCRLGLTMIELVVVMAIIAILMAILLPAIGAARQSDPFAPSTPVMQASRLPSSKTWENLQWQRLLAPTTPIDFPQYNGAGPNPLQHLSAQVLGVPSSSRPLLHPLDPDQPSSES